MSFYRKVERSQTEIERIARLVQFRNQLLKNGYEPIPIRGQQIHIPGWTSGGITRDRILYDAVNYPDHPSTGLRCGALTGIDNDLRNTDHAAIVNEIVDAVIGPTPARRFGSKGAMLCYRKTGEPIGKLVILDRIIDPDTDAPRSRTLVEFFGAGGQFVAYGIHPKTGQPYRWLTPGMEPAKVPLADLPGVTTEQLMELRDALREALSALGYQVITPASKTYTGAALAAGSVNDAVDVTELFLRLIPGAAKRSAAGYYNFSCPSCRCEDGRAGFRVLANGGFQYHCFHTGCEFFDTTGWQPPSRHVGRRAIRLYELLGGSPDDLSPRRRVPGYESLAQLIDDVNSGKRSFVDFMTDESTASFGGGSHV